VRNPNAKGTKRGSDPTIDYRMMMANTEDFMSLFHCTKPTIAKIHGFAVAGGSDIALCCDLVIMADNAKIGYPPARIWGIPTTMQWINRLGPEKAKRMLFTGDLITGKQAKEIGLILDSVPPQDLDLYVERLAKRIAGVPRNQLHMSKLVVNSTVEQHLGLKHAQQLATLFDGFARNGPEGKHFSRVAAKKGFHEAIRERDSGDNIAEGVSESSYFFEDITELISKL
jgi:enoyl-CoA hydratase